MNDFSKFRDYYFIKCFSEETYRRQFNSGEKLYLNSMEYFHEKENSFQADLEGLIFRQTENATGNIILSKEPQTFESIVKKVKEKSFGENDLIIQTKNVKFFINGYICCFAIIPKSNIYFEEENMINYKNEDVCNWLMMFLNRYSQGKYCYLSFYNAEPCLQILYDNLTSKGYRISYGLVEYNDMTTEERIAAFKSNDISKVVFTKDREFAYQHEFRMYINSGNCTQEHIELQGIDLQSTVVKDFAYLSPEYIKKLQAK